MIRHFEGIAKVVEELEGENKKMKATIDRLQVANAELHLNNFQLQIDNDQLEIDNYQLHLARAMVAKERHELLKERDNLRKDKAKLVTKNSILKSIAKKSNNRKMLVFLCK